MMKTWNAADAESAIHKGNGNLLTDLKAGSLKSYGAARKQYNASGKKRGHEYMHRGASAPGVKSRYGSRHAAIAVTLEMLNSPQVQPVLGKFDAGTQTEAWIKDIAIAGDWYGYPPDSANRFGHLQKISKACINIVTDGSNLYIYSSYPSEFSGEADLDLTDLFT
jgi:hypothetical protein